MTDSFGFDMAERWVGIRATQPYNAVQHPELRTNFSPILHVLVCCLHGCLLYGQCHCVTVYHRQLELTRANGLNSLALVKICDYRPRETSAVRRNAPRMFMYRKQTHARDGPVAFCWAVRLFPIKSHRTGRSGELLFAWSGDIVN